MHKLLVIKFAKGGGHAIHPQRIERMTRLWVDAYESPYDKSLNHDGYWKTAIVFADHENTVHVRETTIPYEDLQQRWLELL